MTETSSECPRCRVPMFAATAGATLALGCRRCGGIMIDRDSASQMEQDGETLALADQTSTSSSAVPVDTSQTGIPCPYCQRPMETAKLFGVDVDVCPTHGTWFDRDELRQVATEALRIRGGGPGRAVGAAAAGAAVVGGVALGSAAANAAAVAEAQQQVEQVNRSVDLGAVAGGTADVLEVGGEAVANADVVVGAAAGTASLAADGAAVAADGAGTAAEVAGAAVEGAGSIFGVVLEVMGGIFSG